MSRDIENVYQQCRNCTAHKCANHGGTGNHAAGNGACKRGCGCRQYSPETNAEGVARAKAGRTKLDGWLK